MAGYNELKFSFEDDNDPRAAGIVIPTVKVNKLVEDRLTREGLPFGMDETALREGCVNAVIEEPVELRIDPFSIKPKKRIARAQFPKEGVASPENEGSPVITTIEIATSKEAMGELKEAKWEMNSALWAGIVAANALALDGRGGYLRFASRNFFIAPWMLFVSDTYDMRPHLDKKLKSQVEDLTSEYAPITLGAKVEAV